jgi:5-methylcytosine-specific restriction endonuclease McrA
LCLKHGHLTPSKTVDHIIPVHVRPDWRLVLENTQVICPPCHQTKTLADTKRYGSSTQTKLTPEQVEQRRQVQGWNVAPRSEEEDTLHM